MSYKAISADSHVTEPPNLYLDFIDPKFRDRAPHVVRDPNRGDIFVIEGMKSTIPISLVAAAGKDPSELKTTGGKFEDLHRGGWDPEARMADQVIKQLRKVVEQNDAFTVISWSSCRIRTSQEPSRSASAFASKGPR